MGIVAVKDRGRGQRAAEVPARDDRDHDGLLRLEGRRLRYAARAAAPLIPSGQRLRRFGQRSYRSVLGGLAGSAAAGAAADSARRASWRILPLGLRGNASSTWTRRG